MPELIEIEYYRRLAEKALGRTIASVDAPDAWFLKRGTTATMLESALVGQQVVAARRRGKLLLLDMSPVAAAVADGEAPAVGPTLGLRFGMTGRLIVDDSVGVERLEYAQLARRTRSGIDSLSTSMMEVSCASRMLAGSGASNSSPTSRASVPTR